MTFQARHHGLAIICMFALASGVQQSVLAAPDAAPRLVSDSIPMLTVDGLPFKDLDRNGKLDPYEDWRLTPTQRAADLVGRMTLAEKVGAMMHGTAPSVDGQYGRGTAYDLDLARELVIDRNVTTFVTRLDVPPAELARQNNRLQKLGETGRLGIPLSISTDPRNHYQFTPGASIAAQGFSKWPEALGLGAINDPDLTRQFADEVRREYRAMGIQIALSPQADLATEPRWPRTNGTFGSDPATVISQTRAYVTGLQDGADGLHPGSVVVVAKHWVGYGAEPEGFDGHNYYGREAELPGNSLALHVKAFQGVFDAHVASVMPTYVILKDAAFAGRPIEPVGAGFSPTLLQQVLRKREGFDGVIVSDFGITLDCNAKCRDGNAPGEPFDVGMDWGVEDLTVEQRFALGANAGLDQFGGTENVQAMLAAVHDGLVPESRVDDAARRVMLQKFQIGLFERALVDEQQAAAVVTPAVETLARHTQGRAMVVLENQHVLPLATGTRVFLHGIEAAVARRSGLVVVDKPSQAQLALVRMAAPYQKLHPGYMFGSIQHEGDLDYKPDDPDFQALVALSKQVPTIAFIYLDRPAILTNVRGRVKGMVAEFGASDEAVLDVALGRTCAAGRLPFELPSSMAAVRAQRPDLADDSVDPLYPVHSAGAGMNCSARASSGGVAR